MRKSYPSDISREQFEIIRPPLESAPRKTCPRRLDLYEVFCAVLYLLRSGCQGRMLPEGFPKWRPMHAYFAIWSEPCKGGSLLEQALKNQVGDWIRRPRRAMTRQEGVGDRAPHYGRHPRLAVCEGGEHG